MTKAMAVSDALASNNSRANQRDSTPYLPLDTGSKVSRYDKYEDRPTVSVVIPTHNRSAQLDRLLHSLQASTLRPLEIIVVDNASSDETQEVLAAYQDVISLHLKQNLWCNGARAAGARIAQGRWLLFIDDDNVVAPDMIANLLEAADRFPNVGIVGPTMYRYDSPSEVWCAGAEITRLGLMRYRHASLSAKKSPRLIEPNRIYDVDYFPNCFMARRELFDRGVCLDPVAFPHNWSELDFCLRARQAGFRTVIAPEAVEWHDIGYSGPLTRTNLHSIQDQARARIAFRKRFRNRWTDWAVFFAIIFPVSSAVYLYRLAASRQLRAGTRAYLSGTLLGLRSPVNRMPSLHK